MRLSAPWTVLTVAALLAVTGCKQNTETAAEPATGEQAAAAADTDPAPEATTASKSDPACVGPLEKATPTQSKLSGWDVETNGYLVTFSGEEKADGELILGVVGDIKEDTPENLFNLGRFLSWFEEKGAEAIVVTGDAAETREGLVRVLGRLAEKGLPVFVTVGNRESRDDYVAALAEVHKAHPNVIDLNRRRVVRFPQGTLVSMPGYYDARYIHPENGCSYTAADVEALLPVIQKDAKAPAILVSHGPPRGKTAEAIDRVKGDNVGDPALSELIEKAGVGFGLFGNIHEAGGRATDVSGENIIAQGEYSDRLFLNAGPADSIRWEMNDGTESTGMAAIVSIKDGKAAYWVHRVAPLTEAEQAEAAKLVPTETE